MIQIKRNRVTVTVTASEAEKMMLEGWTEVSPPPEPEPEPVQEPLPASIKARPTTPAPDRPGANYDWPQAAPSINASRRDWRIYSETLGIETGVLNRGDLIIACIEALEALK